MELKEIEKMVSELVAGHKLNTNHQNNLIKSAVDEIICRFQHKQADIIANNANCAAVMAVLKEIVNRTAIVAFDTTSKSGREYALTDKERALITVKKGKAGTYTVGWNGYLPDIDARRKELEKIKGRLEAGMGSFGYKAVHKDKEPLTASQMEKELAKLAEKAKALVSENEYKNLPQDVRNAISSLIEAQARMEGHTIGDGDNGDDESNDE